MIALSLHQFHERSGARFDELGGAEVVRHYGDWLAEYAALRQTVGVLDLGFRSRVWVRGRDAQKFLNGQVTNQVADLRPGQGCYAAVTDSKGKMQSDLNILNLSDGLLLDLEPGFTHGVIARLRRYLLGRGVELADAAPDVAVLSVQGSRALELARLVLPEITVPEAPLHSVSVMDPALGTLHVVNHSRFGRGGVDWFVSAPSLQALAERLLAAARTVGGALCGWEAMETARIEQAIPRFGVDMDETNLPPEAGIEARAVSYTKGCYVGQETLARLETRGQVARVLRGLRLADALPALPIKGDKLFKEGKEVGYITSAARSPAFRANIALGYVRREANAIGTALVVNAARGETPVRIVDPRQWV